MVIAPGFCSVAPAGMLLLGAVGVGAPVPVLPGASFAPWKPVPVLPVPPNDGGAVGVGGQPSGRSFQRVHEHGLDDRLEVRVILARGFEIVDPGVIDLGLGVLLTRVALSRARLGVLSGGDVEPVEQDVDTLGLRPGRELGCS